MLGESVKNLDALPLACLESGIVWILRIVPAYPGVQALSLPKESDRRLHELIAERLGGLLVDLFLHVVQVGLAEAAAELIHVKPNVIHPIAV